MKKLLVILSCIFSAIPLLADGYKVSGKVTLEGGDPAVGAVVRLDKDYLWAVCGEDGSFVLSPVEKGTYSLEASCLGFLDAVQELKVTGDVSGLEIRLLTNSLALKEVVVTERLSKDNINTTRTISRTALDHLQMSGVSDISALLPGGKTVNPDLTSAGSFSLRSGGLSAGNAAFATAVEVDGVRMGSNANFSGLDGAGTRSLQVENIESVEVLTGVPSAEYGDLGNGMVRIITKKGKSPVNLSFSVNPRTYDMSVSKGLEVGSGTLNLSAQWTRATRKLTSPYTSYTRRAVTAEYSNTFAKVLRLEAGMTVNIGGMNSASDPDTFSDEYSKGRDNLLIPRVKATWLLGKSWVTNLSLEASIFYNDSRTREHLYSSYSSPQPAPHSEEEGYWTVQTLPLTFYADKITDSRELDYAASFKYDWLHHWGAVKSQLKAGVQYKADGNAGKGEWYEDPSLSAAGYRPRPYSQYPYMHSVSAYIEDKLSFPIGRTEAEISAGLRSENLMIRGTKYNGLNTLSPRVNARWKLTKSLSLRGGWGISRKLPGFFVLYPKQEYRDIRTFAFSYGQDATYVYYTVPYTLAYNPDLRAQSTISSEIGADFERGGWKVSMALWRNVTKNPYEFGNNYLPITCNMMTLPDGFTVPSNPETVVDHQTGQVYMRGSKDEYFTPMALYASDRTFVNAKEQRGGATVYRQGAELTAEFPEIRPVRTRLRLDAAFTASRYVDENRYVYYQTGWSHTVLPGRSYQYAGVYAGGNSVINGRKTANLDCNLTSITHIPEARLIVTVRLEGALLRSSQNLSTHAFTVGETSLAPTGGDIYAGNSYTAVYPLSYIDLDGNEHPWTKESASDPDLYRLIIRSGNIYTFAADGYQPYFSANLSITKEIGSHVSLSFFANNFTVSRKWVTSKATGVSAIFTPAFYYGLTCRIKI